MPRTRFVVAVVLTVVMVLSAGCAGFGTDGPADPSEESDGEADDQENGSSINDTEATNASSEESDEDSNEYNETDPPGSSDEDDPDESPAVGESDGGESANETEGTDSTDDTEESDDAGSETDSGQEDTASSDDASGDTGASSEDGTGDDAPSENGSNGDGSENSSESGDENADDGDGGGDADDGESGEEEQVYTLTVEADSPVTLERTWEDASTTREPTNGTVEFSVIEGSYTLSADGYYDVPEEMAIQVDSDTTVTMQSEDGGEIEVTVIDAETGEPIEGAEISGVCDWHYSSGDAHVTGETGADGVATAYAELTPTDCDATVSADGYESESVALSVPEDDGLTVELEPAESGTPETDTLTVEVTDAETGEPVEGATVEAHGADGDPDDTRDLRYEAQTNENGVAEMEVQAAMNYDITVEAAGYETGHGEVSLDRETSIELTPAESEQGDG